MLDNPFNTSFPSFSIFDGGVSYGQVDSMLFGGLSSVGHKSLDTHMFELDSYMDGLDYSWLSFGNSWFPSGSSFSRFLDFSPLSLNLNFDPWGLGWGLGWGSDWSMNYGLLALSQPYHNSFADIFQSPQFHFSTPTYDPPDYDFSTTQRPRTTTSYTPSTSGGYSGRTERTAKAPLKLNLPGEGNIPVAAKKFIDEMNHATNHSKPDKPRVAWRFEEINGKRYTVLKLEYEGLTEEKVRRARLDPLVNKIKELVQGDSNVAVEIGNKMISNDENLKLSGVGVYSAGGVDTEIFKEGLSDILMIEDVASDSESTFEIGAYKFERVDKFTVRTEGSHYFIEASREEGERRIRELTGDGNKEEAWIYVEYYDANGFHKRWFECGEKEMEDSVGLAATFLKGMTADSSYSVVRTSFRHQHPDGPGYDPPSDQDLTSAIDLLTEKDLNGRSIESDISVITAEGVYTLTIPSGTTAETLRTKIPNYKSALEKRDGRTTFGKEVHDVGFDCRFCYWGPDDATAAPAMLPQPAPAAEPAESRAVPPPAQAPAPAPAPARPAPATTSASPAFPRWLAEGTGEKFDKPYIKDNGVKELGDVKYREINLLYKKGSNETGTSAAQLNSFISNVTRLLQRRPDLVVELGSYKFSSNPKLAGQDGIRDASFLDARAFKTAVSGSREFAPAAAVPSPVRPASVHPPAPRPPAASPVPREDSPPVVPAAPPAAAPVRHPIPQLIRQFVARFGGKGTDPAKPKIDVKWDDNDGGYILAASYDPAIDKDKITSSSVSKFLDEAKKKFKDRSDIIIAVGEKRFYFDKAASINALTPEKFAGLAGGTLPKPEPAVPPPPAPEVAPAPTEPPAPLPPPPVAEPPPVAVAPPVAEPQAAIPPLTVEPPPAALPPSGNGAVIQPGVLGASQWGENLKIEAGGMRFVKNDKFELRTNGEHYFVEASRDEGERAIGRLAATSRLEESWIYLEGEDKEGRNIQVWFECGIGQGVRETTTQYDFLPAIKERFKSLKVVVDSHLHHEDQDEEDKPDFHPPSGIDIKDAIERTGKFKDVQFESEVVTLYGVYTIKVPGSSSQAVIEERLAAMGNGRNQIVPPSFCEQLSSKGTGLDCSFRYFSSEASHALGLMADISLKQKQNLPFGEQRKKLKEEIEKLPPDLIKRYKITDDISKNLEPIMSEQGVALAGGNFNVSFWLKPDTITKIEAAIEDIKKQCSTTFNINDRYDRRLLADGLLVWARSEKGLNIDGWEQGSSREIGSVQDSIDDGVGACTERSNVLYAVFKMAGLNPKFVSVYGHTATKDGRVSENENWHVAIAVEGLTASPGNKNTYSVFDLNQFVGVGKDGSVHFQTKYDVLNDTQQYLARLVFNKGLEFLNGGNYNAAEACFEEGIKLDPNFLANYFGLGELHYLTADGKGDDEKLKWYQDAQRQYERVADGYKIYGTAAKEGPPSEATASMVSGVKGRLEVVYKWLQNHHSDKDMQKVYQDKLSRLKTATVARR